jgi:hypothetical protein
VQENNFPKFVEFTAVFPDVVNAYSCVFAPCLELLLRYVVTPDKSVTPMVAVAVLLMSPTAVAVMVTTPAPKGAVNTTGMPEVLLLAEKLPPVADPVDVSDQFTPWLAMSLVNVAVMESVCEFVSPARRGLTETVIFVPFVPPEEMLE